MWITSRKWRELEKRIADLESRCQSQQEIMCRHLEQHENENKDFQKALQEIRDVFTSCIYEVKTEISKEIMQKLNH